MKNLLQFVRGYLGPNSRPAVVVSPRDSHRENEVVLVRYDGEQWVDNKGRNWADEEPEKASEVLVFAIDSAYAPMSTVEDYP